MAETITRARTLIETIHPRETPEMGFQSYEMLNGDSNYRSKQMKAFLDGTITLPVLDYPKLDRRQLQQGIHRLDTVLADTRRHPDALIGDAVWDSAGYRMAEMYWLLANQHIIQNHQNLDDASLDAFVERSQELNEQLYGAPNPEMLASLHAEIWAQIDEKQLSDASADLKKDLELGFVTSLTEEEVIVPPFRRTEANRLPTIPPDFLALLREKLFAENADIIDLVRTYHTEVIQQRDENERTFSPRDMHHLFEAYFQLRDPDNESNISVIMNPDATALSWDSSRMAVIVGGKRKSIKSIDEVIAKIIHEAGVHGGRAQHGLQSHLPVLGTGLYTEASPGEQPDYLTFEEGFATVCELAVNPKDQSWTATNMEKTFAIGLAYEGNDFRQVFETLWRTRLLLTLKDNEEPTSHHIENARKASYLSAVRVFRGTPTEMPRRRADGSPRILTYNKDLAYLQGRLLTIQYYERFGDNQEMLDLTFQAKINPLNKHHLELALPG